MPTLDTSFGPIAYSSHGEGAAVVLLHANPGDRRDWDAVVGALAHGHRVIVIDWPGFGDSPAPSPPQSASALKLAALLREILELLSLGPAILIGNSVGAFAAMHTAWQQPQLVRALVLVDPGGFTQHNLLTRAFVRAKGTEWLTRRIAGRFARRYLVRRTEWTRAMIARADAEQSNPTQVAVDAAIWRSFLEPDHDMRQTAALILAPTLFVWGRLDPNVSLRRDGKLARAAMPSATFVEVDTGHAPQAEDPEAFLAAVLPFLAQVRNS